jgi:hypothetical protein
MKFNVILGSAILFATALTPLSVYADDNNLMCRRLDCSSRNGGGNGNLSISGLDINVKSTDRSNNRGNGGRNTLANANDNVGNGNDDTVSNIGDDSSNADIGNDVAVNTPDTSGSNNTNPPQLNSNDIKGFDPFGGLYGPGT